MEDLGRRLRSRRSTAREHSRESDSILCSRARQYRRPNPNWPTTGVPPGTHPGPSGVPGRGDQPRPAGGRRSHLPCFSVDGIRVCARRPLGLYLAMRLAWLLRPNLSAMQSLGSSRWKQSCASRFRPIRPQLRCLALIVPASVSLQILRGLHRDAGHFPACALDKDVRLVHEAWAGIRHEPRCARRLQT